MDASTPLRAHRYLAGEARRSMDTHVAVFEVESKTDANAVERLMAQLYDSLREESRTVRDGSSDSTEMLAQFRTIRDATRTPTAGTLTVTYEARTEEFEG